MLLFTLSSIINNYMTYLNLIYRFGTNAVSFPKVTDMETKKKIKKIKTKLQEKPKASKFRPFLAGTAGLGTSFFAIINLMKLKGVNFLDNSTLYFQNLAALINPSVPEAVKPDNSFFQFLQNLLNPKPPVMPKDLTRGFPEMQAALDGMTKPQLIELFESKEKLLAFFKKYDIAVDPKTIDTLMNSQEYKDYLASLKALEADVSFDITNIGGIALGVIAGVVSITLFYKMSKYLLENPNKKIFEQLERVVESFESVKNNIEEQIKIVMAESPPNLEKLKEQIKELQDMDIQIKDLRHSLYKMKSTTRDEIKDKVSKVTNTKVIKTFIQSKKEDLIYRLDVIIGNEKDLGDATNPKTLEQLIKEVQDVIKTNAPTPHLNLSGPATSQGQEPKVIEPQK